MTKPQWRARDKLSTYDTRKCSFVIGCCRLKEKMKVPEEEFHSNVDSEENASTKTWHHKLCCARRRRFQNIALFFFVLLFVLFLNKKAAAASIPESESESESEFSSSNMANRAVTYVKAEAWRFCTEASAELEVGSLSATLSITNHVKPRTTN